MLLHIKMLNEYHVTNQNTTLIKDKLIKNVFLNNRLNLSWWLEMSLQKKLMENTNEYKYRFFYK